MIIVRTVHPCVALLAVGARPHPQTCTTTASSARPYGASRSPILNVKVSKQAGVRIRLVTLSQSNVWNDALFGRAHRFERADDHGAGQEQNSDKFYDLSFTFVVRAI